jgi:hypothetical protein
MRVLNFASLEGLAGRRVHVSGVWSFLAFEAMLLLHFCRGPWYSTRSCHRTAPFSGNARGTLVTWSVDGHKKREPMDGSQHHP